MNQFGKPHYFGLLNFENMKQYILLTLLIAVTFRITAQKSSLDASIGYANFLNKKASGFSTGLNYQRKISQKQSIGLEISYIFTERRGLLPEKLNEPIFVLRDFTSIPPIPSFGWTTDGFPDIRLPTKPDKYFNFNVGVNYLFDVWAKGRHNLTLGIGGLLTFSDEKEIVEVIKGDFRAIIGLNLKNVSIPVFQYDTYLDVGFQPQIRYRYQLKEKMNIGLTNKYHCYPISNRYVFTLAAFLSFEF